MKYVRRRREDEVVVEDREPESVVAAALLVVTAWKTGNRSDLEDALRRLEEAVERMDRDDDALVA